MPSTQALPILSFAARSRRARRLFSRCSHSASTSSPNRSSNVSFCRSASFCCSAQAAASAVSPRARILSIVGSVSTLLLSVVVVAAADVLVVDGWARRRWLRRRRDAVEVVLEDRLYVPVRAGAHREGAGASRLQPLLAVPLAEPQDPEARAVALLRVAALREDRLGERLRARPDRPRPVDDPGRRPLRVLAVRPRHVLVDRRVPAALVAAQVGGDALALVEQLDRDRGEPRLDLLMHERVRCRV